MNDEKAQHRMMRTGSRQNERLPVGYSVQAGRSLTVRVCAASKRATSSSRIRRSLAPHR